ncbi:MAG TPA: toll/interleukin-1 receptor domain-containing protein, partial [Syntrophobacteria bacterium]|nr:toll/interleukin-1 receptor domain-containing protein [Syntrophobacteria bacterium]
MRVFISHISEEAPLAHVLKDWIESSFAGQCDVFVSSDKDDIPAGSKWLEEIESALGSASALIVLCSPSSLSRPWISFETGCGWIK